MYCIKCGANLVDNSQFCSACGVRVQAFAGSPNYQEKQESTSGMWTAVLVLNILGLNWLSRFLTGHIGTGILILFLDIISVLTLAIYIGWIGIIIGFIIWIVDIVTIGSGKWVWGDKLLKSN